MESNLQPNYQVYAWGIGAQGQLGIDVNKRCKGKSKHSILPEKTLMPKGKNPI